jgi:hypothetical protein
MVCKEKMRLVTAYAATADQYAASVARLRMTEKSEFSKALAASETARTECGKARRAIQEHRIQHSC